MSCNCFFINTKMEDKKMKNIITITTAIVLLICFSTIPAHADRKTMEGFMLGTGVAILTAAIYNGINKPPVYTRHQPDYNRYDPAGYWPGHRKHHHRKYSHNRPRAHWEVDRIWIEPVYETKYNPGHYNRRGNWVNGRYEKFLIQDGYWQEEKVWVRY